jgi:hypothetical protein
MSFGAKADIAVHLCAPDEMTPASRLLENDYGEESLPAVARWYQCLPQAGHIAGAPFGLKLAIPSCKSPLEPFHFLGLTGMIRPSRSAQVENGGSNFC